MRDVHSSKRVLKIMHEFDKYSSLRANVDKCESCWIGKAKKKVSKPIKCRWTSLAKTSIKILGIYFSYDKKLAEKDNLYSLILDCRSLLNIWKQRWLSLAGKIQIFISLIASKSVYISTMTTVSDNFCETLQSLQKEFVCGGRKAKIKHSTLIGDYHLGGLKNVDIPSKIFSLKFMWIKALKDRENFHPWKLVASHLLSSVGGEFVFHANLKLSPQYKGKVKQLSPFYRELVYAWETLNNGGDINLDCKKMILSQSLWNNSLIVTSDSITLFNDSLFKKRVAFVNDLIDDLGNVKSWEAVSAETGMKPTDFLGWYGILNAVPKEWKMSVRNCSDCERDQNVLQHINCGFSVDKTFKHIEMLKTKDIYNICISKKFKDSTTKDFFIRKFDVRNDEWKKIYTLAGKATIDTRMRIFQYKILNNIPYLNRRLYRMKIVNSPMCSLCGQNVETVTHLFFSCIESHKLGTEIRNWSTSCIILPELTEKIIFLGWFEDHPHNTLINHTILLYKQFIYKSRGAKSKINITGFRHFLKNIINTEKVIAKKRNKVDLHLKKWNPFLTLL